MISMKWLTFFLSLAVLGSTGAVYAYDGDGDGVDDQFDVCCGTPTGLPVDGQGRPLGDLDFDCDVDVLDFFIFQSAFTGELAPCASCNTSSDCAMGDYCAKLLGECESEGTCSPSPVSCPPAWEPVCGCEDYTHANACFAALSGSGIDYDGPCQPPGCESNADCDASDLCAKADGDCAGLGQCQATPSDCMPIYEPVCGCNGITYNNSCFAALDRVGVDHDGPCVPPDCQSSAGCPLMMYCAKASNDCNGTGTCEDMPLICLPDVDLVCGCDGLTYDNSCYAAQSRASVDYSAECQVPGCRTNDDCGSGNYCMKAAGDCDGVGVCQQQPAGCIGDGPTVCGCDGQTYAGPCTAAKEGRTSVAGESPCGP